MNKKLVLSALTAGIMLLLSSCGETIDVSPSNDPIQTTAKLTVVVTDGVTGDALTGADVTLLSATGKEQTKQTVAGGIATFEDVYVGSVQLLVKNGDEYAAVIASTNITSNTEQNVHIASDRTFSVALSPKTASISGYVYYTDKVGKVLPAAGAKVRVQLDGGFIDKVFESAPTSATGNYTISNLPANASYSLYVLETVQDGITYKAQQIGFSLANNRLIAGNTTHIATNQTNSALWTLLSNTSANVFEILGYPKVIELADNDQPITITFSDAVNLDPAVYSNSTITVSQGADISWNSGKDVLTLTPVGKWDVGDVEVTFSGLRSVNGKTLNSSITINVVGVDLSEEEVGGYVKVSPAVITNGTSQTVNIKWAAVEGATSYDIYYKQDPNENYEVYNGSPISAPTTEYSLSGLDFSNGKNVRILVRARNAYSETKLDTASAKIIVLKDSQKPNFSTSSNSAYGSDSVITFSAAYSYNEATELYSYNSYNPTNNNYNWLTTGTSTNIQTRLTQAAAVAKLYPFRVCFSEPMDTTAVLTRGFDAAGAASAADPNETAAATATTLGNKLKIIAAEWRNASDTGPGENCLRLTPALAADSAIAAATYLNVRYQISGLKDKAGNDYEYNYGSLIEPKIKNTVDFRFVLTTP